MPCRIHRTVRKDVRHVNFKRLPKAIRDAGISMIERKLKTGTVTDLVTISDTDWHQACRRCRVMTSGWMRCAASRTPCPGGLKVCQESRGPEDRGTIG